MAEKSFLAWIDENLEEAFLKYPLLFQKRLEEKVQKYPKISCRATEIKEFDKLFYGSGAHLDFKDPIKFLSTASAWKMVRGKFRPTLFKLIESNDGVKVGKVLASCNSSKNEEIMDKIDLLTESCRGVGPATASVLVSIRHDECPYFSDQAAEFILKTKKLAYSRKELKTFLDGMIALRDSSPNLRTKTLKDLEQILWVYVESSRE